MANTNQSPLPKVRTALFDGWFSSQTKRSLAAIGFVITGVTMALLAFRHVTYKFWTLASLPMRWHSHAENFILSHSWDNFDTTFANYSRNQLSAAPYHDIIPPIIHHISLGGKQRDDWDEAVQSCLDWHPGWETHLWTDKLAYRLVEERYPELLPMWKEYHNPIMRIDALRYMILFEFGGAILDMDLKCLRALGPLRRFEFVAPEAHPTGFSISFMMAARGNHFVGNIIANLKTYKGHWLGLPYASVMFSTGGHFASVIHTYQTNRSVLKILPAPLHSLKGRVSTPLFHHLGSSTWHSYDAQFIQALGRRLNLIFMFLVITLLLILKRRRMRQFLATRWRAMGSTPRTWLPLQV